MFDLKKGPTLGQCLVHLLVNDILIGVNNLYRNGSIEGKKIRRDVDNTVLDSLPRLVDPLIRLDKS